MPVKTTNNAFGTLAAGINNSVTTINLSSGQGAKFPSLSAGEFFYGTLIAVDNTTEIVKVTARSSDALTVTRAQDNTSASAFSTGDRFELRPTAALFDEFVQKNGDNSINGDVTFTGDDHNVVWDKSESRLRAEDGAWFSVGTSDDAYFYHDFGQTNLVNLTGDLFITQGADDKDVDIRTDDGSGSTALYFKADGSTGETILYHYGTQKLSTKSTGVEIDGSVLDIKNDGSQSELRLYCESSNAHYASLKAPAHADFSGNITLTLPATTGTLLSTANSDAPTTTTSSGDADFVLVDDGGVMKKITPANLGIGGSGTLTVQDEGSALSTEATTLNFVGAGVTASGTGAVKTITISGGGGSSGAFTDQTWGASLDSDSANESKLFFKNDHANIVIGAGGTVAEPTLSLDETGSATNNVFIGNAAGNSATTAVSNVFLGTRTGDTITTGDQNTFIGYEAGRAVNSDHDGTTAVGYQAGYGGPNAGSERITAIGFQAGNRVRSGTVAIGGYAGTNFGYYGSGAGTQQSVCVGYRAGYNYYTYYSDYNVHVGYQAGQSARSGDHNTTLGVNADGLTASTGYAVALGSNAKAASNSISIGFQSQNSGNSGSNNMVSIGYQAGYDMDGGDNSVYIGFKAGFGGGTADNNIGIGRETLYDITSASDNIAIGSSSLTNVTEGEYNIGIGTNAGDTLTTGEKNTIVGTYADMLDATADRATIVGYHADGSSDCTSIGYQAMHSAVNHSTGITAVGREAGYDMDGGDYSTYVGYQAGRGGGTGDRNNAFGEKALYFVSGTKNCAFGASALYQVSSGDGNTAFGHFAGHAIGSIADDNTALGNTAYYSGTAGSHTGTNNTCIGANSAPSSTTVSNEITLGDSSIATLRCQVTSITALSDQRDKTDIEDLDLGLKFVNAMKPRKFTWNRRDGKWSGKRSRVHCSRIARS